MRSFKPPRKAADRKGRCHGNWPRREAEWRKHRQSHGRCVHRADQLVNITPGTYQRRKANSKSSRGRAGRAPRGNVELGNTGSLPNLQRTVSQRNRVTMGHLGICWPWSIRGPFLCRCGGFFSINTVGPAYLRVLNPNVWHPQIQPTMDGKQCFRICRCSFPTADSHPGVLDSTEAKGQL